MVSVRYIVGDVRVAGGFYTSHLGFDVELDASPGFAAVSRDSLRLLLSSQVSLSRAFIRSGPPASW